MLRTHSSQPAQPLSIPSRQAQRGKKVPSSGGFRHQKNFPVINSSDNGAHLRISPSTRYDVRDGFGETGPQQIIEFPRLLAPEHLFIPPPEPEKIKMDDEEVQCDPVLFKKELESIQDYQHWLNETVDPFLKDLKMAILQGKPDSLNDFVLAYVNALATNTEKPKTVDMEEFDLKEKKEKRDRERERKNNNSSI